MTYQEKSTDLLTVYEPSVNTDTPVVCYVSPEIHLVYSG